MGEKKWFVLWTAGGKEKKAKEYLEKEIDRMNLQDVVSKVLVPTEKVYEQRGGKRVQKERILYPSYIFIETEEPINPELEYLIKGHLIPGVAGFLSTRNSQDKSAKLTPIPLRDDEVTRLLGRQDEQAENPGELLVEFEKGEQVKITDGPFTGFTGTIDEIVEDRSKLKVIVNIFGRNTVLELSFNQVSKVTKS
jgi:transcriptional antiterminator NusG